MFLEQIFNLFFYSSNYKRFFRGLHATLSEVASSGIVGNTEFCIWMGTRDKQDDPFVE